MRTRIKLCWQILRGKSGNWVFFDLSKEKQLQILNRVEDVDLSINYIGVDKQVMKIITDKLGK